MGSNGDQTVGVWSALEDVLQLTFQVRHNHATSGLKLLESNDDLEEVAVFICALSEEKQERYLEMMKLLWEFWCNSISESDPVPFPVIFEGAWEPITTAMSLERKLKSVNKILDAQTHNSENPAKPESLTWEEARHFVLSAMDQEQRLHQALRKLYTQISTFVMPEDVVSAEPWKKADSLQLCVKLLGRGISTRKISSFYIWTSQLYDLLQTHLLENEKVLEEMQVYMDTVLNLAAQQEQASQLPHSIKTKD